MIYSALWFLALLISLALSSHGVFHDSGDESFFINNSSTSLLRIDRRVGLDPVLVLQLNARAEKTLNPASVMPCEFCVRGVCGVMCV